LHFFSFLFPAAERASLSKEYLRRNSHSFTIYELRITNHRRREHHVETSHHEGSISNLEFIPRAAKPPLELSRTSLSVLFFTARFSFGKGRTRTRIRTKFDCLLVGWWIGHLSALTHRYIIQSTNLTIRIPGSPDSVNSKEVEDWGVLLFDH
jgi:hypothetical protein